MIWTAIVVVATVVVTLIVISHNKAKATKLADTLAQSADKAKDAATKVASDVVAKIEKK